MTKKSRAKALKKKLEEAEMAAAKGKQKQKQQHLDEFRKNLEKGIGRWITAEQTAILIRLAQAL